MAHKKGLGSSRNGRDSNAKRLGVKIFAGQTVTGGEIIVRQRGTSSSPGLGVGHRQGRHDLRTAPGVVQFREGRRGPHHLRSSPPPRPPPAERALPQPASLAPSGGSGSR